MTKTAIVLGALNAESRHGGTGMLLVADVNNEHCSGNKTGHARERHRHKRRCA